MARLGAACLDCLSRVGMALQEDRRSWPQQTLPAAVGVGHLGSAGLYHDKGPFWARGMASSGGRSRSHFHVRSRPQAVDVRGYSVLFHHVLLHDHHYLSATGAFFLLTFAVEVWAGKDRRIAGRLPRAGRPPDPLQSPLLVALLCGDSPWLYSLWHIGRLSRPSSNKAICITSCCLY